MESSWTNRSRPFGRVRIKSNWSRSTVSFKKKVSWPKPCELWKQWRLPCERIHTQVVRFTHRLEFRLGQKKHTSPAAATATPRHDASWTQKYHCFWLKKRTTKTLPGWWVFVCKNYMVLLYLLDFCWWKKSLKNGFEQKTHLFWRGTGEIFTWVPATGTNHLGPPYGLKVSFIVTKAQSGLTLLGWGSDTFFFWQSL